MGTGTQVQLHPRPEMEEADNILGDWCSDAAAECVSDDASAVCFVQSTGPFLQLDP
jgi:hypothetical protein